MNQRFAFFVVASIPLSLGCVDVVPLADKIDGGARDAPADAPTYTDAPPMDAPSAVCAACGGPSSANCLYAPGCGSAVRVCAPNTCGDAVALQHCGCDGRTFVSGCLTPDRPFLHTGACEADGGAGAGTDAPAVAPYCPEGVDRNTAQNPDLRFPRAVVLAPPDTGAAFPTSASYERSGRWLAPRRLATPVDMQCAAGVASDPACRPDTVIRVQAEDGGAPAEFVVSVSVDELAAIAPSTEVVLRLVPIPSFIVTLAPNNVILSVERASDHAPLLFVANAVRLPGESPLALSPGALSVARPASPFCVSRPEPTCRRTLAAYALELSGLAGARPLSPGESAVFGGAGGRFLVRNRLLLHRVPTGGSECADLMSDQFSFEIVRQPDP